MNANDSGYYDSADSANLSDDDLARKRQQQALQAALVGQQNTVDPAAPPTDPLGGSTSIGAGTPWADGASAPTGAPAGYHWDANLANFVADAPAPTPTKPVTPPTNPSGGVPPPTPATNPVTNPVTPPNAGPLPAGPGSNSSWQDYINSFNTGPAITAPTLPTTQLPLYQPEQLITSDALNAENQQFSLLQRVLAQPDQYSEENVRQMQEAQKEQALALQKGNQDQLTNRYAAMGRYGSGNLDAQTRRMQDQTNSQILQGNRDVNLQASTANMNSRMAALQNANSVLNESVGRRQAQANQDYLGYNSQKDQTNFALQSALGQAGLTNQANAQNIQKQGLALQAALGTGGLSLDQYKTDLSNNLGWYNSLSTNDNFMKQLLANLSMFNAGQNNNSNNTP